MFKFRSVGVALVAVTMIATSCARALEEEVVPNPKSVSPGDGTLVLDDCRISIRDGSLVPIAKVARDYLAQLFGAQSHVQAGNPRPGGIALKIDKRLKREGYRIEVTDRAIISGGDHKGVAWGVVTLLQSANEEDGEVAIPHVTIADQPDTKYRGLLVDVARQWHPIDTLKQCVILAQWYKIGYMQLHFTDDQSWTLPSMAHPKLPTAERHYTTRELEDLEAFANARGVTIVPEIEMPGHAGAAAAALADLVGHDPAEGNTMCPGRKSTYEVLDALVGEACKVFRSTPYFHIGADEVNKSAWAGCRHCIDCRKMRGISGDEELYRHFIVRMNEIVKRHGKQMIVWEGFKIGGRIPIPKDIIVMGFECHYELPPNLVDAGYTVINTAWQPLYVVNNLNWSPEKIYAWNLYRWDNWTSFSAAYPDGIDVKPTPLVIGAQMCAWEQPAETEIHSLRERLPAMSERIWEIERQHTFGDFAKRLKATDAKLTKLLADFVG